MAKLTAAARKKLPKRSFALPGKGDGKNGKGAGSYPIPDEAHARDALARVAQHGTPAEIAEVKRAVHKKFPNIDIGGKGDKKAKASHHEAAGKLFPKHPKKARG